MKDAEPASEITEIMRGKTSKKLKCTIIMIPLELGAWRHLITLTVRVAGATVVSGVIGHCRPSQFNKLDSLASLDWLYN